MKEDKYSVTEEIELLSFLLLKVNPNKKKCKALLSHHCIYVNGKNITKYNYLLKQGQSVFKKEMQDHNYIQDKRLAIIYEDKDIIVVNKPAKLLTIASDYDQLNNMYRIVSDYIKAQDKRNRLFIVHRLDKDTSGVLLFAKSEIVKNILQENWEEYALERGYIAIVEGQIKQEKGTLQSYLKENQFGTVMKTKNESDGKMAITHYEKIAETKDYTMLKIIIATGRKNQIRVQLQDLRTHVIGDLKYGAKTDPIHRLGLHANSLTIKHPITKKELCFQQPLPKLFKFLFKEELKSSK